MYECERWTIKKAEGQRIGAFELWCWKRLLRVPWTARRLNQSILKEINPEYSLEELMPMLNTLATWCEELTHGKRPWCWERLKAGRRRSGRQRMRWFHGSMDMSLSKLREIVNDRESECAEVQSSKESTQLSNWITKRPLLLQIDG